MDRLHRLARLRRIVFAAILAAIVLRTASLLISEAAPEAQGISAALGVAALVLLCAATVYALGRQQQFPRYGKLVLVALLCVGLSQAIPNPRLDPPGLAASPDAGISLIEIVRIVLYMAGLGFALVGFFHSIFELLEARSRQHFEHERLTSALAEQERAEAALRSSESQLRRIFEGMEDAVFVHDLNGRLVLCNESACTRLGYTRDEFLQMTTADLDAPEFASEFQNRLKEQMDHKRFRCEGVHRTKDGRLVNVDIHTTLIEYHGQPAVLAVIRDITERKLAEHERQTLQTRVAQAEKLESLGVMAGGIAHDFNNLLMGVLGNASLALLDVPPDSPVRRSLELIESSAQRAAELSQKMLAYSGRATFAFRPIQLAALVREARPVLAQALACDVDLAVHCDDNAPNIEGDRGQLMQVLLSLVTNASEACTEKGGTVTVTVETVEIAQSTPRPRRLTDTLRDGPHVVLQVRDNGIGMDDQVIDRIFDPFYSTKFTGRGLGLAAVMGIIRGHHGSIAVDSTPGVGSVFTVYFPVSTHVTPPEPEKLPTTTGRCGRSVLIVDDESVVLSLASRALMRAGYSVLTADNGLDGIEMFRQHAFDIALVILDMTMPRLNGAETCRVLKDIREDVSIVISSGYSHGETMQRMDGLGVNGFLHKPYAPAELVQCVENVLAEPEPASDNNYII